MVQKGKQILGKLCDILIAFFLTFVFMQNNPLHIWVDGDTITDSSVLLAKNV